MVWETKELQKLVHHNCWRLNQLISIHQKQLQRERDREREKKREIVYIKRQKNGVSTGYNITPLKLQESVFRCQGGVYKLKPIGNP